STKAIRRATIDMCTERIGESVEANVRIGQLGLWDDGPVRRDTDPLTGFDGERVTEAAIVRGQLTDPVGGQIAVEPGQLRLTVNIEAGIVVPGGGCAHTVGLGGYAARTEER